MDIYLAFRGSMGLGHQYGLQWQPVHMNLGLQFSRDNGTDTNMVSGEAGTMEVF